MPYSTSVRVFTNYEDASLTVWRRREVVETVGNLLQRRGSVRSLYFMDTFARSRRGPCCRSNASILPQRLVVLRLCPLYVERHPGVDVCQLTDLICIRCRICCRSLEDGKCGRGTVGEVP